MASTKENIRRVVKCPPGIQICSTPFRITLTFGVNIGDIGVLFAFMRSDVAKMRGGRISRLPMRLKILWVFFGTALD